MMPLDTFDQLYQIAEAQAGYFSTRQAEAAGVGRPRLSRFAASGRLQRVRHGVYRLAHFPHSRHEDLFIAWLESGPNSVISHESALVLYDLSDDLPAAIHVTVPRTASRRRHDLQLHTSQISRDEISAYAGLPVTTVARTIADVVFAGLSDELAQQAVQEALARGLAQPEELATAAKRRGRRVERIVYQSLVMAGHHPTGNTS